MSAVHSPHHPRLPGVLVIDDEVRSQEAIRRTLEEDFEVFCASGAEGAEQILVREMPAGIQIVLCDQRMPGKNGVDFLKEVRERWPDVVRTNLQFTNTNFFILVSSLMVRTM